MTNFLLATEVIESSLVILGTVLIILKKVLPIFWVSLDWELQSHQETFVFILSLQTKLDTQYVKQCVHNLLWYFNSQNSLLPELFLLINSYWFCLQFSSYLAKLWKLNHIVVQCIVQLDELDVLWELAIMPLHCQISLNAHQDLVHSFSGIMFTWLLMNLQ